MSDNPALRNPRGDPPHDLWDNPMGTDGFEFVEYTGPDPQQLAALFEQMGFVAAARHRSKNVTLYKQGDVNFILNAEPESFAQAFARLHGPSVCAIAFRVKDAAAAYDRAIKLGAKPVHGKIGPMELNIPAIEGIGGSLIYLVDRHGEGIQHIALATRDIYRTVEALRQREVAFMAVPETYYEAIDARLPGHGEDLGRLRRDQILIDGAPGEGQGLLLQIFTETVIGPIFFEIIERKGNEGFGEGNFRALFESIEADQIRRGVLADPS